MDLYQILGIDSNSTIDDIKSAYRNKAKLYHPDLNNGNISRQWEDIQKAYHILIDNDARQFYDDSGYIREDDAEIDRSIISFFREYIRNKLSYTDIIFELDLIKEMSDYCDGVISKNKKDITILKKNLEKLQKLQKRFKRKYEIKKDFINIVITEQRYEIEDNIQQRYKNIDIFRSIKFAVNNYEFDITKYLQGDNTNVSEIYTETD